MRVSGGRSSTRSTGLRLCAGIGVLVASLVTAGATAAPAVAGAATPSGSHVRAELSHALGRLTGPGPLLEHRVVTTATVRPHDYGPNCTFNGLPPGNVVAGLSPGGSVSFSCSGWLPDEVVEAIEFSPLIFTADSADPNVAADQGDVQTYSTNSAGDLQGSFTLPNPFVAADPAAVCPVSAGQIASGLYRCGLLLSDNPANWVNGGYQGDYNVALGYASGAQPPPAPTVVGIASNATGSGYWTAWSDGRVVPHGSAGSFGDASNLALNSPIAHIVATADSGGYWLVAGDGGTFAYGDAGFFGSMGAATLNQPVVDLAPTHDDGGYWLVASDGGIFAFGDAAFHGSMGGLTLNQPVVGISADDHTGGYWEVAADGGIFSFGAPFFGSTGAITLHRPINGMVAGPDGQGYLFVASDGGIFAYGDAAFHGSAGNLPLAAPIVGMTLDPATGGYWLVGSDGGIFAYDAPFYGAG